MTAAWDEMVRLLDTQRQRAAAYAAAGRPVRFQDQHRADLVWLASPEISEGHQPGAWRVTSFDGRGPIGHIEFHSAYEAFFEMRSKEPLAR